MPLFVRTDQAYATFDFWAVGSTSSAVFSEEGKSTLHNSKSKFYRVHLVCSFSEEGKSTQ